MGFLEVELPAGLLCFTLMPDLTTGKPLPRLLTLSSTRRAADSSRGARHNPLLPETLDQKVSCTAAEGCGCCAAALRVAFAESTPRRGLEALVTVARVVAL